MNQNIFKEYDLGYLLKGSFVLEPYEHSFNTPILNVFRKPCLKNLANLTVTDDDTKGIIFYVLVMASKL